MHQQQDDLSVDVARAVRVEIEDLEVLKRLLLLALELVHTAPDHNRIVWQSGVHGGHPLVTPEPHLEHRRVFVVLPLDLVHQVPRDAPDPIREQSRAAVRLQVILVLYVYFVELHVVVGCGQVLPDPRCFQGWVCYPVEFPQEMLQLLVADDLELVTTLQRVPDFS